MDEQQEKLALLKDTRDSLMREAEKAAHEYFTECELGLERAMAAEIYENLRNAGRVYSPFHF